MKYATTCLFSIGLILLSSCNKQDQHAAALSSPIDRAQLSGRWQMTLHYFDTNNNSLPDSAEAGPAHMDAAYWMELHSDLSAVDTYFATHNPMPLQGGVGNWSLTTDDSLRLEGNMLDKRTNKIFLLNDSTLILQGYSSPAQLQFFAYQKG